MIKLAMEIPTSMLPYWAPLCDTDFILAHKVLEDAAYASFFAGRERDREVILDNSTHEFGKPLPNSDLRRAAQLSRADWIIVPDIVNPNIDRAQHVQNIEWMRQAAVTLASSAWALGAVISGRSEEEREEWVSSVPTPVDMICFSFHMPDRLAWWGWFQQYVPVWRRIHLLGMSSVEELQAWVAIAKQFPTLEFSFDTCKPLKLGVQGILMEDKDPKETLRGSKINSKTVLDMDEFTIEQVRCIEKNIVFLRKVCAGEI